MLRPTIAAMYPPRRMFYCYLSVNVVILTVEIRTIKRGRSAVKSHPADTELAEIFVLGTNVSLWTILFLFIYTHPI